MFICFTNRRLLVISQMSFVNKTVLITGGSSGIGAATAVLFAKEGASVAIVGRNEERLNNVAKDCEKHGVKPLIIKADISKDESASEIVKQTIDTYGKLDVLVNNAGILFTGGLFEGNLMETYDKIMNTNLRAVINLTRLAVPHLIESKGNIVNVSSVLGTKANPWFMSYCVSKAGLDHFSRLAALELASKGVRVNIVSPGAVVTDILETAGAPVNWDEFGKKAPLGKVAYPNQVADLIMFLASNKAESITGANYNVDNGVLLTSS